MWTTRNAGRSIGCRSDPHHPHGKHRMRARRPTGSSHGFKSQCECPLSGNRSALRHGARSGALVTWSDNAAGASGRIVPHVRHRALAQRTAGLESGHLALSERPVWGNCPAVPQLGRCFDRCVVAMFAANASGRFVRIADLGASRSEGQI
jgi:hypothetical protein